MQVLLLCTLDNRNNLILHVILCRSVYLFVCLSVHAVSVCLAHMSASNSHNSYWCYWTHGHVKQVIQECLAPVLGKEIKLFQEEQHALLLLGP